MTQTKTSNLYWLVREIAKRAKFTIGDVEVIMKTFKEIMEEEIAFKRPFIFLGLFKLQVTEIPAHQGWNAVENESMYLDKSYRIVMTPSRNLLSLLREDKDNDLMEEDEY